MLFVLCEYWVIDIFDWWEYFYVKSWFILVSGVVGRFVDWNGKVFVLRFILFCDKFYVVVIKIC